MHLSNSVNRWLALVLGILLPNIVRAAELSGSSAVLGEAALQKGLQYLAESRINRSESANLELLALRSFREAAENGNPKAMFNYALGLAHPIGTNAADFGEAAIWYERAASNNIAEAAFNRALLFLQPPAGLKVDPEAAIPWLERAARSGLAPAQATLGQLCMQGRGLAQDYGAAAFWFRAAIGRGVPEARFGLSRLIEGGWVKANTGEDAHALLVSAAEDGVAEAQELVAKSWENTGGDGASEKATKWYKAAAENGRPLAQWQYGRRLIHGLGSQTNRMEGEAWMMVASESINRDARQELIDLEKSTPAGDWVEVEKRAVIRRQEVEARLVRLQATGQAEPIHGPSISDSPELAPTPRHRPRRLVDVNGTDETGRPGLPPESYRQALTAAIVRNFNDLVMVESRNQLGNGESMRGKASITYRLHADGRITDIHFEPGSTGGRFQSLLRDAISRSSPFTPWSDAILKTVGNDYADLVQTLDWTNPN